MSSTLGSMSNPSCSVSHRKRRKEPTRPRPQKDDDDDDVSVATLDSDEVEKGRSIKRRKVDGWEGRIQVQEQAPSLLTNEEIEQSLAFCCDVCRCPDKTKKPFQKKDDKYVQGDEYSLWHRRCCHKYYGHDPSWLPPLEEARLKAEKLLEEDPSVLERKDEKVTIRSFGQLHDIYKRYKDQEKKLHKEAELESHDSRLQTNSDYMKNMKHFSDMAKEKMKENRSGNERKPAVVLDAFGGIGAGIVCLKKLRVAIKKVIHVEHDKVANHVYKENHDPEYNPELPKDGIQHVYYDDWDHFVEQIDDVLKEHGPIDIIIGSPPFVDTKKGLRGKSGQYMKKFGELVCYINAHGVDQGHTHVWYLAENKLTDEKKKPLSNGSLTKIQEAFCINWSLEFNSRMVSPIDILRTYISNIPCLLKESDISLAPPAKCLDDGYDVPSAAYEELSVTKIPSLSALMFRKIPRDDGKERYEGRCLTIVELERLMGLPEGYVSKPVEQLFQILLLEGHERNGIDPKNNWKNTLDPKYHVFSGVPVRFVEGVVPVALKLAAPLTTKSPSFYSSKEYSKRLLAHTFSVPTVEMLLRPIEPFFDRMHYPNFDYKFAWQRPDS